MVHVVRVFTRQNEVLGRGLIRLLRLPEGQTSLFGMQGGEGKSRCCIVGIGHPRSADSIGRGIVGAVHISGKALMLQILARGVLLQTVQGVALIVRTSLLEGVHGIVRQRGDTLTARKETIGCRLRNEADILTGNDGGHHLVRLPVLRLHTSYSPDKEKQEK